MFEARLVSAFGGEWSASADRVPLSDVPAYVRGLSPPSGEAVALLVHCGGDPSRCAGLRGLWLIEGHAGGGARATLVDHGANRNTNALDRWERYDAPGPLLDAANRAGVPAAKLASAAVAACRAAVGDFHVESERRAMLSALSAGDASAATRVADAVLESVPRGSRSDPSEFVALACARAASAAALAPMDPDLAAATAVRAASLLGRSSSPGDCARAARSAVSSLDYLSALALSERRGRR